MEADGVGAHAQQVARGHQQPPQHIAQLGHPHVLREERHVVDGPVALVRQQLRLPDPICDGGVGVELGHHHRGAPHLGLGHHARLQPEAGASRTTQNAQRRVDAALREVRVVAPGLLHRLQRPLEHVRLQVRRGVQAPLEVLPLDHGVVEEVLSRHLGVPARARVGRLAEAVNGAVGRGARVDVLKVV